MGQMKAAGIDTVSSQPLMNVSPFFIYISMIPFLFYPLLVVGFLFVMILKRFSFGIVASHERCALLDGNVLGGKKEEMKKKIEDEFIMKKTKGTRFVDFVFPVILMLTSCFLGVFYFGNYWLLGGRC